MLVALLPLAIAVQGVLASPLAKEPTTADILEYINTKAALTWESVEGTNGAVANATTFDTALWDEAVSVLSAGTAGEKRSLEKRANHCYGSGPWAKQWQVRDNIGNACRYFDSLAVSQSSTITYPALNLPTIHFTKINRFGGNGDCVGLMEEILIRCHGNNDDTRGGNIWDERDRNEYAADPN